MASNRYKVDTNQWKKWKGLPQAVYNRTAELLIKERENLIYAEQKEDKFISRKEFRIIALNAAFIAASETKRTMKANGTWNKQTK